MENLEISCLINSEDYKLFSRIINQGIDSRLEAFTDSNFFVSNNRLFLNFHHSEISILLRRLSEIEILSVILWESAYQWENDILTSYFGISEYYLT